MVDEVLYRFISAFIVGTLLSLSGSLTQMSSQNKLASPSTLGFDGLAVFSILIGHFFISAFELGINETYISIFFFFLFSTPLILTFKSALNKSDNYSHMDNVILIGMGFNLLIGAFFSFMQFLFMAKNISFPSSIWFGSFRYWSMSGLILFTVISIVSLLVIRKFVSSLLIIAIGPDFAKSFGININKVRFASICLSLVLTGFIVIYFGVFSFMALIMPHILRSFKFIKLNPNQEFYSGALISGFVFALLDYGCYEIVLYGAELPVGMISAIFGSLFLVYSLVKQELSKTWH